MKVHRLRVNHIDCPCGYKFGNPTFSWCVDASQGTHAVASRIVVTSKETVIVDTGWAQLDSLAAVVAREAVMPEVYLACGTEDGFLASTRAFRDQLLADGVRVAYDEQPGGHDWDFWDTQIKKVIDWLPLDDAAQGFGSGAID